MPPPEPLNLVHGPVIKPAETPQLYPRVVPRRNFGASITLLAVDAVDTLLTSKHAGWRRLIARFLEFPYDVNIDVERSFMSLTQNYHIALLCDMRMVHAELLHKKVMPSAFHYIIPCTTKDEYALFFEAHRPQLAFSNLAQKFQCETFGAVPYIGAEGLLREIERYCKI